MAKKPNNKKTTKAPSKKKTKPASTHVQFLVRTSPEIKEWLETTAAANGMSRDGLVRMLLSTARATWNEQDEQAQHEMFDVMRETVEEAVARAVVEAMNKSPSAVVARGMGKSR